MATDFPADLDNLTNPAPNDPRDSPTVPHAAQHANANDAIEALEAKVGVDGSTDENSLDFLVKSAEDPGHSHSAVSVLEWNGVEPGASVYHGLFWPPGVPLPVTFIWEAWVCRLAGVTGYWASEGHGGNHALLAGFAGGIPTGNIFDGAGGHSWNADYVAEIGEWLCYAVVGDGAGGYWVLINGIPCFYSGAGALPARQAQYGNLMIGGSDHNNLVGRVAQVRAWEGSNPVCETPWMGYGPERHFAASLTGWLTGSGEPPPDASFCVDYLSGLGSFPDLSDGYRGRRHSGRLYWGNGVAQSQAGDVPRRVIDPTAPFGNQINVPRVRSVRAPRAVPAGAKLFDSYGRADSISAFTRTPTMGTTEGGSLGPRAYVVTPNTRPWGVFNGEGITYGYFSFSRVLGDSPDVDVRIKRRNSAPDKFIGIGWRIKADATTGYKAYLSGTDIVVARPDGTGIATWSPPTTTWDELRIVAAGANITGHVRTAGGAWTQIGTLTDGAPQNVAEVGVGPYAYYGNGAAARIVEWAAY